MRYAAIAVVVIGAALILWLVLRSSPPAPSPTPPTVPINDAAAAPAPRVRKLDREARKKLGEQIAAARAKARTQTGGSQNTGSQPRGSQTGGSPPRGGTDELNLEAVAAPVRDAMLEAIPILAECYTQSAPGTRAARAQMMLTSDPELGTVIDTEAIKDGATGQPLAPEIEACLRDTIDTLGLPPLALDVGGRLRLEYSFRFDD